MILLATWRMRLRHIYRSSAAPYQYPSRTKAFTISLKNRPAYYTSTTSWTWATQKKVSTSSPVHRGSTRARILPARNRTYRDHHECTEFARAQIVQVACKNRGRIVAVKMLWRPRRSMTRERVFRVRVESCQSKAISQPPKIGRASCRESVAIWVG